MIRRLATQVTKGDYISGSLGGFVENVEMAKEPYYVSPSERIFRVFVTFEHGPRRSYDSDQVLNICDWKD